MPELLQGPANKILEKLIALFLKAETAIVNELGRLRSKGLADYHMEAALRRVQQTLQELRDDSWEYVPRMIQWEFYRHNPEMRRILESTEKHARAYSNAQALTIAQTAIVERLTENLMGELVEATEHVETSLINTLRRIPIGRLEPDIFRETGLFQVSAMEAMGQAPNAMVNEFVEALRREGVTAFIDKAGRRWSLHTYGSMALRTTSRQAEVLSVLTENEEQDLYKITSHNTSCPLCAPFEGRVYSRSGKDPRFPPLAAAFGKIDPKGPDDLTNTYLNIHPNCIHALVPWTPAGETVEQLEKIEKFSSPKTNPFTVDPRSEKVKEAYRRKEDGRRKWLADYRQWEKYKLVLGDKVPKTFQTFQKHKIAGDDKYKAWQSLYRRENAAMKEDEDGIS